MLRRLPTSRLLALIAVGLVVLGGGAAAALAALNQSGPTPPAKPLDTAVHDALTAPQVAGVTARISFTNHLIDASSLGGTSPLLSGATGRLWASSDGRFRLELQSDNGDVQVTGDGTTVTVVDATQNQAYRLALPAESGSSANQAHTPPTLAQIDTALQRLASKVNISGATPSDVAGQQAYTVRISPKQDGGLVGGAELAWDAANGVPLRVAVYAKGDASPVLELKATDISFGTVPAADLSAPIPAGTRVTNVDLGANAGGRHDAGTGDKADQGAADDPNAVASQLPFTLSAPDALAGMPRTSVRVIGQGAQKGALVTYGTGLGGIYVVERPVNAGARQPTPAPSGEHGLRLPTVSIDGVQAQELPTALGTLLQFERGGVQYVVIGSVPAATAQAAARGL